MPQLNVFRAQKEPVVVESTFSNCLQAVCESRRAVINAAGPHPPELARQVRNSLRGPSPARPSRQKVLQDEYQIHLHDTDDSRLSQRDPLRFVKPVRSAHFAKRSPPTRRRTVLLRYLERLSRPFETIARQELLRYTGRSSSGQDVQKVVCTTRRNT